MATLTGSYKKSKASYSTEEVISVLNCNETVLDSTSENEDDFMEKGSDSSRRE